MRIAVARRRARTRLPLWALWLREGVLAACALPACPVGRTCEYAISPAGRPRRARPWQLAARSGGVGHARGRGGLIFAGRRARVEASVRTRSVFVTAGRLSWTAQRSRPPAPSRGALRRDEQRRRGRLGRCGRRAASQRVGRATWSVRASGGESKSWSCDSARSRPAPPGRRAASIGARYIFARSLLTATAFLSMAVTSP